MDKCKAVNANLVLGLVDPSAGGGPRGPDPRFLVWGPLVLAVLEASTFVGSRSTCVTVGLCRGLLGGGLLGATLLLGLGCRLLVLLDRVLMEDKHINVQLDRYRVTDGDCNNIPLCTNTLTVSYPYKTYSIHAHSK